MRSIEQAISMHLIPPIPFVEFPKISRYNREVVVTEKIDGDNACVYIDDTMEHVYAASRTRWISPEDDNKGFARWVKDHSKELLKLGPGSHFGEWWGQGIHRGYGLKEKRFSLFNVSRWKDECPACCSVVPTLWTGTFVDLDAPAILKELLKGGSKAAPGFGGPEGIVIFHTPSYSLFKMTLDHNDTHKGVLSWEL